MKIWNRKWSKKWKKKMIVMKIMIMKKMKIYERKYDNGENDEMMKKMKENENIMKENVSIMKVMKENIIENMKEEEENDINEICNRK